MVYICNFESTKLELFYADGLENHIHIFYVAISKGFFFA